MALFLLAQIAGRTVAIDSAQIESVVDIGTVIPVPRADAVVRGLTALRSRVVTVICTCAALGLPVPPPDPSRPLRAVITIADGHHYAILVDALEDVAPFVPRPLPSGIALEGGWLTVGRGLIERVGEPILVIALDALVPSAIAIAA